MRNLSASPENRARIVAEGAMPRLTSLLRSPVNINPTTQSVGV